MVHNYEMTNVGHLKLGLYFYPLKTSFFVLLTLRIFIIFIYMYMYLCILVSNTIPISDHILFNSNTMGVSSGAGTVYPF